jgi:hypothetical protein
MAFALSGLTSESDHFHRAMPYVGDNAPSGHLLANFKMIQDTSKEEYINYSIFFSSFPAKYG